MESSNRKSHTALEKIYYWTASIHKWNPLLADDGNKNIIIDSLKYLSNLNLISVHAFVIMPDHLHLIWQQNGKNGKETPKGSFMKYTAHLFLKQLKDSGEAETFLVSASNKKYEIWQRDSLGIEIYSREVAMQKLGYIHVNPLKGKWFLAKDDISYYYSSAAFYHNGANDFGFLKNIYQVFDGD